MNEIILKFTGAENHGANVAGVPSRDLTQADIDASGYTTAQLCAFSPVVFVQVAAIEPTPKQFKRREPAKE